MSYAYSYISWPRKSIRCLVEWHMSRLRVIDSHFRDVTLCVRNVSEEDVSNLRHHIMDTFAHIKAYSILRGSSPQVRYCTL